MSQEKGAKPNASFRLTHDEDLRAVLLSADATKIVVKLVQKRGRKHKQSADLSMLGKRRRSDAEESDCSESLSDNDYPHR